MSRQERRSWQDEHQQKPSRKRIRINYIGLFTRIVLIGMAVAGLIFMAKLLRSSNMPGSEAVAAFKNDIYVPEPTQSADTGMAKTQPTETADGLLQLINWDNPAPYERPEGLVCLDDVFGGEVVLVNGEGSVNAEAGAAAHEMFLAADAEGIGRYLISSAYRSAAYQEKLFAARTAADPGYGSDPYNNPVKVMPGKCSEHMSGLAIDILAQSHETANDAYADTPEGRWLAENAHRFGFILRYPQGKEHITGVIFEPWHYRYVGKTAADEIWQKNLCLEEYLEQQK